MNIEAKVSLINSQIAMFYAEKAVMDAANVERARKNLSQAYIDKDYETLYKRYEPVLGYNAVVWYLFHEV